MRYRDDMTPEEEAALLAESERLDKCYADAAEAEAEAQASEEEECEDPVRDGWVGKDGRP